MVWRTLFSESGDGKATGRVRIEDKMVQQALSGQMAGSKT
jgi:hypothetical protein